MKSPTPADFRPLAISKAEPPPAIEGAAAIDLLAALRVNRRAQLAASGVVLLLLFAFAGPLLWQQDPAKQWLSQVSSGPTLGREVRLLAPDTDWPPEADVHNDLVVLGANTQYVRLQWPRLADATHYRVYRVDQRGAAGESGIPLAQVKTTWYEDRLQLRSRNYQYRVIPYQYEQALTEPWLLEVTPDPAISWFEAQLQGLLPATADPQEWQGATLRLPAHPLGTDALGRDMLARLMHGARTSLFVGIVAPLLFIGFGMVYGAVSALSPREVDNWMMRGADFVVALPFLLFMILFRVGFGVGPGESGILPMLVAMVILIWPSSARLVRGQVLQLRAQPYVEAARLGGASQAYLIRRHLLPNVMPVILVSLSFAIPQAIFVEAFLSFIGMGVAPPIPSLGSLCNDGMKNMLVHPHELLFPAIVISLAVLSFNILGESLRDAMDVRLRTEPV